eukprot:4029310-Pyramimonas_sp.AAC.1
MKSASDLPGSRLSRRPYSATAGLAEVEEAAVVREGNAVRRELLPLVLAVELVRQGPGVRAHYPDA